MVPLATCLPLAAEIWYSNAEHISGMFETTQLRALPDLEATTRNCEWLHVLQISSHLRQAEKRQPAVARREADLTGQTCNM